MTRQSHPGSSHIYLCLAFAAMAMATSWGNPLVMDAQRRSATMTAEKVMITVGQDRSTVKGDFTFHLGSDDWPEKKDTHVLVYIPVLLSHQSDENYRRLFGTPIVSIRGQNFPCFTRNDLSYGDEPQSVKLPKGWSMRIFEGKIPLHLVSQTFRVGITYIQPNFPGQVAGYVPLLPPKDASFSEILFVAPEGHSIRKTGLSYAFQPGEKQLSFKPEDRKLLTVRLVE